ncbi:MAG TPA: DoxX family protein [Blastocatellia bacterium]|nr:DoxX family protein [Blastocatellia bacterium]
MARAPVHRWALSTRIAFRFFSVYFVIYVLSSFMLTGLIVPNANIPALGYVGPLRRMVEWTAARVFGATQPLVVTGSGSGDKMFDWVQAFCFLVIAAVVTVVWSFVSRRRESHIRLHIWFRLFLRFALGSTLIIYGAAKAIPLQMPYPSLARLLEPFGHFSPMGVLWSSIGASRPYEIFTGCAELAAGILLIIPSTVTLGALVSLGCTIQVFILNMAYDVPVKLFSFHLLLMSLFLLAPDARRLLNLLVLNRPADRSPVPQPGGTARAIRIGVILQLVFGAYLFGMNIRGAVQAWTQYGGGAPKSPLYGIWNVAYMSIDDVERAPLITDNDRWRRVVFDRPTASTFQRMDDTFARFGSKINMETKSLTLTKQDDPKWTATFSFQQPAADRMILQGEMDGKKVQMRLELFPREKFLLVNRGFNWIQEYPFNQ